MKMRKSSLVISFVIILLYCFSEKNVQASVDMPQLVQDNTSFALDMYQKLCLKEGNLFFSLYSISAGLAMTYAGAKGDTEKQIAKALRFSLEQNDLRETFASLQGSLDELQKQGDIKLNIANSLWPQKDYPILNEYLDFAKKYYGITITPVDFKEEPEDAIKKINTWTEDKTEGKIQNVLTKLPLNTSLVLANAIYFKGDWKGQFDPNRTIMQPFCVEPNKYVYAPMMENEINVMYAKVDDFQIIELPYVGENVSMFILLPQKNDGLPQLENRLSAENLALWKGKLEKKNIDVFLPSFKMTCEFNLIPTLKTMGMVDSFSLPPADFSGMTGKKDMYINTIVHKAIVAVNEKGTEASASTQIIFTAGYSTHPFCVDHPFLFLIQDKQTGTILFIGRLTDPTPEGIEPVYFNIRRF